MADHFEKHEEYYSKVTRRSEHSDAERQLLLGAMPPLLVGNYNELVITTGWVLFFSVAFPAGSFFCIFASYLTVYIELEGMALYKRKDSPMPIRDIGVWLDYVETVSLIGVFCTTYIVIFTSKKLEAGLLPGWGPHELVILVFVVQHAVLLVKVILAEVIEDEPGWVQDDIEVAENRVAQIRDSIMDRKLIERLADHYEPRHVLAEVLRNLHKDREMASLLIPRLKKGCVAYMKGLREDAEGEGKG